MAKVKRARAADAKRVAAPRAVDPPEEDATSSDSGTDADDAPPPPRPAKRLKEAAARGGGGAAAAAAEGGEAAAGSPPWRNKEKPLVLCSRGIPGRCAPLPRAARLGASHGLSVSLFPASAGDETNTTFIHACQLSGLSRADRK